MTDKQQQLTESLSKRNIESKWDGNDLNGVAVITKANGKRQYQRFVIHFDDAATLDGARVGRVVGAYSESFARDAYFETLRIGEGEESAEKYNAECVETGIRSGASQEWIDSRK